MKTKTYDEQVEELEIFLNELRNIDEENQTIEQLYIFNEKIEKAKELKQEVEELEKDFYNAFCHISEFRIIEKAKQLKEEIEKNMLCFWCEKRMSKKKLFNHDCTTKKGLNVRSYDENLIERLNKIIGSEE